ncbi:Ribose-phosphate pyrophosphokinase [Dissostichus eleginoides]|uniref:Ribose-phosphate pyrophosphokinase n=1 Tax=Dissostichus eleginoides TaxID=100907 RepID=A0AAD9BSR9_DISEL|nr:Ribose-phosphate pyrophosphokinase [Dissostichus eleginoides]
MAARVVAAAHGSPFLCYLLYVYICCMTAFAYANIRYNRQELLDIGFQHKLPVLREFQRNHNIPDEVARSPGSPWIVVGPGRRHRRQRERKQKRGCRSGLLLRQRNQPHKPPLPSMYLTNARSIVHKTDDLELQLAGNTYALDSAFRSGDRALYSAARADLRRGITKAKTDYIKKD